MRDEKSWFYVSAILLAGAAIGWNFISALDITSNKSFKLSLEVV